jgi:SAM-dependent methyltransferase
VARRPARGPATARYGRGRPDRRHRAGDGWSTIALARAFPEATVDGYDADEVSVAAARRHAAESGGADLVAFHHGDVAAPGALRGPYDLVVVFEVLHDLSRPQLVLERLRGALADGGVLLVADERVSPQFAARLARRTGVGRSRHRAAPGAGARPRGGGTNSIRHSLRAKTMENLREVPTAHTISS